MKILILGGDGYLGWPTAMHLSARGHEVAIVDSLSKRYWEAEIGVEPLMPIRTLQSRIKRWKEISGHHIELYVGDIAENHRFVYNVFQEFLPDSVIHYAEQPSAPFSMADRGTCVMTQRNNVIGTLNVMFAIESMCPDAHVIKLGTMGEYGTPNIDIEEGWLEVEHNGRADRVMFPKKPHSFYHLSKVHDSHNLEFACRVWDMRVTDLNQGVVYGINIDETQMHADLATSFHYDAVFGTVLNRFVVQAAKGIPLTVYGSGMQTRGYLNIRDTLNCVELAVNNPAEPGEYRVFNQFTEEFKVIELAERVQKVSSAQGLKTTIDHIENPRTELEDHYYHAKHSKLQELGLEPHLLNDDVISHMLNIAKNNLDRIDEDLILPKVKWKARKD